MGKMRIIKWVNSIALAGILLFIACVIVGLEYHNSIKNYFSFESSTEKACALMLLEYNNILTNSKMAIFYFINENQLILYTSTNITFDKYFNLIREEEVERIAETIYWSQNYIVKLVSGYLLGDTALGIIVYYWFKSNLESSLPFYSLKAINLLVTKRLIMPLKELVIKATTTIPSPASSLVSQPVVPIITTGHVYTDSKSHNQNVCVCLSRLKK